MPPRSSKSVQGGISPLLTKPMTSLPGDTTMSLKKLCSTLTLTLLLATSALAGDMECPITSPPSAPAAAPTQGSGTTTSSASSATTVDETSAADVSVTEAALAAVETVLALF